MHRFPMWLMLCFLFANLVQQCHADHVVFAKRAPQKNDVIVQSTVADLVAERSIRQQNQLVDKSRQTMKRTQNRTVTIIRLDRGRPIVAKVTYGKAATQVDADNRKMEITQPVSHTTYFVTRNQDGKLSFADETGKPVTSEEERLLEQHFEAFGKPNPLADFLNGKTVAIGQNIQVPDAVARELLGLTGNSGKTDRLTLRLARREIRKGVECACFETLLRTSSEENTKSLLMKGELAIETATCRTQAIRLAGPVAISETRGPVEGRFTVSTNGTLQVNVDANYSPNIRVASRPATIAR